MTLPAQIDEVGALAVPRIRGCDSVERCSGEKRGSKSTAEREALFQRLHASLTRSQTAKSP